MGRVGLRGPALPSSSRHDGIIGRRLTVSQNTGVVIDTPEAMEHFRMANAIMRLRFETKTGMSSSRGSTLQFVRREYGIIAGTKKKALALMEQKYLDTYGWEYGKKEEA